MAITTTTALTSVGSLRGVGQHGLVAFRGITYAPAANRKPFDSRRPSFRTVGPTPAMPRNKYREVPLNSTAQAALTTYLPTLADESTHLFPSRKRGESDGNVGPVGERALVYIVNKYAKQGTRARPVAKVADAVVEQAKRRREASLGKHLSDEEDNRQRPAQAAKTYHRLVLLWASG